MVSLSRRHMQTLGQDHGPARCDVLAACSGQDGKPKGVAFVSITTIWWPEIVQQAY